MADGASPTQAHVTSANNAYTTLAADWAALKTLIDAANTAIGVLQTNAGAAVTLQYDTTAITAFGDFTKILRHIERVAVGDGNVK